MTTLSHLNQVNKLLSSIIWNWISIKKVFLTNGCKKKLTNSWKISCTLRNLLTIIPSSEARKHPRKYIFFVMKCQDLCLMIFDPFKTIFSESCLLAQCTLWRIVKSIKKIKGTSATWFQNHQHWYCRKEWEKAVVCVLK